jgi:hypothetical protein
VFLLQAEDGSAVVVPETPLDIYHRAVARLQAIGSEWGSKSFGCVYLPESYIAALRNEVSFNLSITSHVP